MDAQTIRHKYIEFFKSKGHSVIPRAPLVPMNDPSTLFTGSGMQPLVPYLLGDIHPEGDKLVNSQTCLRAEDMDEVGDNRHTTFFEMLGNWSLGDYFKNEQLHWIAEFLMDQVQLDPAKLYVTCFIGDEKNGVPKDSEAAGIWTKIFAAKNITAKIAEIGSEEDGYVSDFLADKDNRIFYYDAKKNWWSRAGVPDNMPVGEPGGPDSEVFYDFGTEHNKSFGEFCHPNCDCGRFMEIGNSVFMAYKKTENGFEELSKPNVDFGGGLERMAAAKINDPDMFKISVLWPIIEALEVQTGKKYDDNKEAMRVIADHVRAAVFLGVDGVAPSNHEQGYVVRRFLRRAIRFAFDLGVEDKLLEKLVPVVIDIYKADYPEVEKAQDEVLSSLVNEENLFRLTLIKGEKELNKMLAESKDPNNGKKLLSGGNVFKLYDTFGYPKELTQEIVETKLSNEAFLSENWEKEFDIVLQEQRERSRTAGQGVFKGGLADHSVETTKLHTSHHLLLRALKDILGDHVFQRGSNITSERLRIDFSNPEKVTREQLDEVEKIVNQKIAEDLPVIRSEIAREDAEKLNAEHEFGAKYPDMVSVYSVGPKDATNSDPKHAEAYSIEFCGGPHVEHTGVIAEGNKTFKITKEQASSAGVRRIKAVLV